MSEPKPKREETSFDKFRDLTKRVMSIPKREIEKRESEYRDQRKQHKSHNRHR